MSGSLKQDLERTLHLIVSFTDDESLVEMNARAALRRIDLIVGDKAFLSVRMKDQTLDLLRAGVRSAQDWRGEIPFVVDEFEDLVSRIRQAPVLEDPSAECSKAELDTVEVDPT